MSELHTLEQIQDDDAKSVGGKARNLARMLEAGLPVPPGFCITTAAYRRLRGQSLASDPSLIREIGAAYRQLGGGLVAVRSSAMTEDSAAASFAGQLSTILGVQGESAVCDAVARCWESLDSERAAAHRRRQGIGEVGLALAVVVQRLVAAEVAGVLFTRDPLDPHGQRMLVEASRDSAKASSPARLHRIATTWTAKRDMSTGYVLEQHIAEKTVQVTAPGTCPVLVGKQTQPSLDAARLAELADLRRRVESIFGSACDVEWALADGRFWLLQARPSTAAGVSERDRVRREEIAALAGKAETTGTIWSRYNIPEGMPEPTPMTWTLFSRLLSARGGYGLMRQELGHGSAADGCVYDLVAGCVSCNLSREIRQHAGALPFDYPFAALKADPRMALAPQPVRDLSRAGALFWLLLSLRLLFNILGGLRRIVRLGRLSKSFAHHFRQEILPVFAKETARATVEDWSNLSSPTLLERFHFRRQRTLDIYARDSLKSTALAVAARAGFEFVLRRKLGVDRSRAALGALSMGVRPDPDADLPAALCDLLEGRIDRAVFLHRFGHRGNQEMELAHPRWAEEAAALDRLHRHSPHPAKPDEGNTVRAWDAIADEAKLSSLERTISSSSPVLRKLPCPAATDEREQPRQTAAMTRK